MLLLLFFYLFDPTVKRDREKGQTCEEINLTNLSCIVFFSLDVILFFFLLLYSPSVFVSYTFNQSDISNADGWVDCFLLFASKIDL